MNVFCAGVPQSETPSASTSISASTSASDSPNLSRVIRVKPHELGRVRDQRVTEISGAVTAQAPGGGWWVLNDGGHSPRLLHLGVDGLVQHQLIITGAYNADWEDLAAFEWLGRRYLLIADTGDNEAKRRVVKIIVVPEPSAEALKPMTVSEKRVNADILSVESVRTLRVVFPDGARDVESVAVDVQLGAVLLLSKRDDPPRLYSVPLSTVMQSSNTQISTNQAGAKPANTSQVNTKQIRSNLAGTHLASTQSASAVPSGTAHSSTHPVPKNSAVTLTYLQTVPSISDQLKAPVLRSIFGFFAIWPTAMDARYLPEYGLTRFVVLTYSYAFIFDRPDNVSIKRAFSEPVARFSLRNLPQAEAVFLEEGGEKITVFSEGLGTPILQWSLPALSQSTLPKPSVRQSVSAMPSVKP